jgi:hypothetical protein
MIYQGMHGSAGIGMWGYDLEEVYYVSKDEIDFLKKLEKKDTRVLELYKQHLKPEGVLNTLCFWFDSK